MALCVEHKNVSNYLKNNVFYLYCIENTNIEFVLSELSLIKIACKCAHIAFINDLTIRRCIYIMDENLGIKIQPYTAPILIQVESSCDFKVNDYSR